MSHIQIVAGGTRAKKSELTVSALADFGYSIINRAGIFEPDDLLLKQLLGNKKTLFVISPTVYELYGDKISAYMQCHLAPGQYHLSVTPSTELNKTMDSVLAISAEAKAFGLDRDGCFVAIGGGIVLDMVGFAASMYRRGTRFIKIPTTLVGQVDVAVGVKTGINFQQSKNMLGTYYPAYATINDKQFLDTLSARELRCGMAEVIKMGLVCDADIFEQIEAFYAGGESRDIRDMDYDIFVRAMLRMIEELQPNLLEIELERLVDFGHTFSMRFETHSDHQHLHGEAVAMDMALSCCLSHLMGYLSEGLCVRALALLVKTGLPVYDENCCTLESLLASIEEVSLHRNAVNLVLPSSIGEGCFIKEPGQLPPELLQQAVVFLKQFLAGLSPEPCPNPKQQTQPYPGLQADNPADIQGKVLKQA
ncbi:sedoheptulose 7-phosphate cyclase [Thalassomonas haliotis]|uniref:Sedoheptulose 7-phosphate cyclase n=1 Tax=Thalassomonas haliotis TaxID=485448 RepID=A0ABY7VCK7_9GAMM|nr:sedoheptulose 7-phosphate cyclase [Thalassomonas haliotis]WDE11115.1 sedoheptulose 7-phosphate cyclase [Thalassomonas haliotis]